MRDIIDFHIGWVNDDLLNDILRMKYTDKAGKVFYVSNNVEIISGKECIWVSDRYGPLFCTILYEVPHKYGNKVLIEVDINGDCRFTVSKNKLFNKGS